MIIFSNFNGLHVHVQTATGTKISTMQQTANICRTVAKEMHASIGYWKIFMLKGLAVFSTKKSTKLINYTSYNLIKDNLIVIFY